MTVRIPQHKIPTSLQFKL